MSLASEIGNAFLEAASLHHLGLLALESARDSATARSLNQQSLALLRDLGDRRQQSNVLLALARVARADDDVDAAFSLVAEASMACQEVGDDGLMAYVLHERAAVEAAGRAEQAVRVAAAAAKMTELLGMHVHPAIAGAPSSESERWLRVARRALGEQRFALAWRQGQGTTLEDTVARALAETTEA